MNNAMMMLPPVGPTAQLFFVTHSCPLSSRHTSALVRKCCWCRRGGALARTAAIFSITRPLIGM